MRPKHLSPPIWPGGVSGIGDVGRSCRRLSLRGKRCSITFSICRDWPHSSKRYFKENLEALGIGETENVRLLAIPVDIVFTFKGLYFKLPSTR